MATVHDYGGDSAQELINQALKKAVKRKRTNPGGKWQSLEDRLFDCYVESCEGAPLDKRFCHGVRLLEKVVLQDNLSALVVNLYPGNEGYSLMLKGKNGADSETVRLPYEESEFLDYLDAQELPPLLVDLLERSQANVFYSGCVVVEVRDYRRTSSTTSYDSNYVLLRPTIQSLICDINAMTSDGAWTQEDKHSLESQLLVATQPPLCLDPSPDVALINNQLQYHQNMFNTHGIKRCIKRHSQSYLTRCSLMAGMGSSSSKFKVIDFLSHHKRSQPPVNLRLAKTPNCVDSWRQRQVNLPKPLRVEAELFAKVAECPKFESNSLPETVQEMILEGEKTNNRAYYCRVTIQRRPSDQQYVGELYLEEDNRNNEINKGNGHSCKFLLGSKRNAQRYLQQFQDLYTEEGRKSVKISSIIPGQAQSTATQSSATVTAQSLPTPQSLVAAAASSTNPSGITVVNQPVKMVISTGGSTASNSFTVGSVASVGSVTAFVPTSLPSQQNQLVQQQGNIRGVSLQQQYGQKVTVYQHGTRVTSPPLSNTSGVQTMTAHSTGSKIPATGTFYTTGQPLGQSIMTVPSGTVKTHALPSSFQQTVSNINRRGSISDMGSSTPIQSPTTPTGQFTNMMGPFMQAGTVTVPAGVTVSAPPGTQLVGAGNIQTQYLTTNLKPGQSIHTAPSGPLTILQGTTTIQPQQTQLVQQRGQTSSFTTIPANLVPISQVPTVVTTLANLKMTQPHTSSVQPNILRNNPLSPPLTTVVTSRSLVPQIHQQQPRKISPGPLPIATVTSPQGVAIPSSPTAIAALTSTVNRTTQNVQPLVPLTAPLPQQQFQVRMVQFQQQQQISVQPQGTINITPQQQVTRIQQQARARGQGRAPNPRRRASQNSQNK